VWTWLTSLFKTRYKLTVSYNSTYGDADDQTFIVRKFYNKQDKYLKFQTDKKEVVELRGAEGLNYRIEEI
jgi:hypothetical protein